MFQFEDLLGKVIFDITVQNIKKLEKINKKECKNSDIKIINTKTIRLLNDYSKRQNSRRKLKLRKTKKKLKILLLKKKF